MLRRTLPLTLIALLALALLAGPASAQSPQANAAQADGLLNKTLYKTGASGRFLMAGTWYFRADATGNGPVADNASPSTAGWTPVSVPNAWNARDYSDASFAGGVGWYKKSFHLPSAKSALSWVVRFESVNYRSKVYLNGRLIGKNTGAYLPFEIRLPGVAAQARRLATSWRSASTTAASRPTSRRPACRRSACRPAAGGTTAACCARSTCARSTTSTSTRSRSCRTCRAGPATPPSPTRRRSATSVTSPRR